ncbi:MAG: NPCBM/NEW2 domain-containing protein, partial [Candidatus Hydrogenedentes bacterium]|nr:NPCBM/NEW2 domain-containing protein [Candidatus Hydrogenedentota bacterium]
MTQVVSLLVMATALGASTISVPGDQVSRILEVDDGRLHTGAIRNGITGETLRIAGPEFVITYGDGERVTSDAFGVVAVKETASGVRATLVNAGLGIQADIDYTAPRRLSPWLYKQIAFTNFGDTPFLLRTVELEHLIVMDEAVSYSVNPEFPSIADWGQPVYTQSLWFGVEFPATRSAATRDGIIFLRHHPGIELEPGGSYTTKRAVLGVAQPHRVRETFLDYVTTLTPIPNPPRANIYWNGFRVIKPPNRTEQGIAMVEYARKLRELTGFTFDGWTYDAGFDMYRPDALFVPNEEDIWDQTREALQGLDTPLGFWTSFSPIFDTPTHEWGRTQGYELQHDSSYCLAGPVYYQAIRSRLEDIVSTYKMNTINFDGMYWGQGFGCNEPGHGHLVGVGSEKGAYATERIVENKVAIFESLRRINPGIVLDLFVCNEWASPWWLMQLDGVHSVAGDTLGCDIPSPWLRDELITVRDIQVFEEHRRLRRQFPLWAEDLYGTQVRADHLIDGVVVTGESMAARWEDEYTLALAGRGAVANHIICSDLGVLDDSPGGLQFLGDVANWTKRNAILYRNFQLLGGEPSQRQPYGYSHGDERGRSLVALRNPWIEPRTFELAIDEQLDLGLVTEPLFATIVYPYRESLGQVDFGATVSIPLRDYDVVLLEVRTKSRQFADTPEGLRWATDEEGVTRVCDTDRMNVLPAGRLFQDAGADGVIVHGTVDVPDACESAQVQLMLLPAHGEIQSPAVSIDGVESPVAFHERRRGSRQDAWALIDVPTGVHELHITVPGRGAGQIAAWLRAEYALLADNAKSIPAPEGDFYPVFDADADRRIVTLLPVQSFDMPLPPLPEGDTLGVADLRNRCIDSKVGFFQLGWDQSCWPEDPALRIGATTYSRGIGVHAPAHVVSDIDGAFTTFKAEVGLHGVPAERKSDPA